MRNGVEKNKKKENKPYHRHTTLKHIGATAAHIEL